MDTVRITVNGAERVVRLEPWTLLIDYLRGEEGLTGARAACDSGQCGACMVLVGGVGVKSCMVFAVQADGSNIETVEGLGGGAGLSAIQEALLEGGAERCGYCIPGMQVALAALLRAGGTVDEAGVRAALAGNECRCGGLDEVVRAAVRVGPGEEG